MNLSDYISSLDGVALLGTLWLMIGCVSFIAVLLWVLKLKKSYLGRMASLPLDRDRSLSDNVNKVHQ